MKANLSCEECQRELVALIDGALTPSVARVVEGHAASCASCGRALLDFRGQALRLRRMELYPVPASLEGRVLRELRVARGFLNAGWQRISAAVGAVSFVLLVGILANLARIAKGLGIPDPYVWLVSGIDHSISGITSASAAHRPSASSASRSQSRPPSLVSRPRSKRASTEEQIAEWNGMAVADWDTRRLRESGGDDPLVPQRRFVLLPQAVRKEIRLE